RHPPRLDDRSNLPRSRQCGLCDRAPGRTGRRATRADARAPAAARRAAAAAAKRLAHRLADRLAHRTLTRMKVLFLTHAFPRQAGDAAGSFVLRLAIALRDEGVETSVVAPAATGLPDHDQFDGVAVDHFRYAPRRF